ncbi:MAG: ROK family protein [Candidatus Aminicenantales bacterium]
MERYAIGIDLGGTKVEACLVDAEGRILSRRRIPSEPGLGRERVVANILGLVAETAAGRAFEAAGMGTPGTYDSRDDIMHGAPHTPLYETPGLVSLLREKIGVPLAVENDANCLALAEYFESCRGRYASIMAVILGTGMGSGLILDHRLYRGSHGNAGEIGHASIDIHGRLCECGRRGCPEAYLSGPSLTRRYRELSGDAVSPREIYLRFGRGEAAARTLFDESAAVMAEAFANAVNTLDLEAIILGGGVSNIPLWYERVPPLMDPHLFGVPGRGVPILRAKLGDSAGVLGAAFLGLRTMGLMEF